VIVYTLGARVRHSAHARGSPCARKPGLRACAIDCAIDSKPASLAGKVAAALSSVDVACSDNTPGAWERVHSFGTAGSRGCCRDVGDIPGGRVAAARCDAPA
jgi:hypothetical protein